MTPGPEDSVATEREPGFPSSSSGVGPQAAPGRRRRRRVQGDASDRPCRHACLHYDCRMDRGDPLPPHVTAYQDGDRYHDAETRRRARELAVERVDERLGAEAVLEPTQRARAYDEEERRVLAAWDREADEARTKIQR